MACSTTTGDAQERSFHGLYVGVEAAREDFIGGSFVDGVDLRSFIKSAPDETLSPDQVSLIALDLAYALEHAHATLVHRDISPSNILLSRSGEAKLADFGIAKALDNAKVTASRSAKGKIPYMAPEQMRGELVDGRADLFSLGVVMFEALAGRRPFDGAHDVETMQKVLDGDRPGMREVAPEVPAPLADLVESLLELDRDQIVDLVQPDRAGGHAATPAPTRRRGVRRRGRCPRRHPSRRSWPGSWCGPAGTAPRSRGPCGRPGRCRSEGRRRAPCPCPVPRTSGRYGSREA